jgi:hypothetical protein
MAVAVAAKFGRTAPPANRFFHLKSLAVEHTQSRLALRVIEAKVC